MQELERDRSLAPRYPDPPWPLSGTSIQAIRPIDAKVARRHVPAELRVLSVWPGSTLGVLYCASYESPSVLRYRELIVAPALVATGGRIGFWISHIYVDDPTSQAGGREIWGLPKALASFAWDSDRREVSVHAGDRLLCRIGWRSGRLSAPMPLCLPAISRGASGFQFFSGRGSASVARVRGEIHIEADSPFEGLGFERSHGLFFGRRLKLRVGAPRPLGR